MIISGIAKAEKSRYNREDQEIPILTLHLLQIFIVNVNTLLVQNESTVASYN